MTVPSPVGRERARVRARGSAGEGLGRYRRIAKEVFERI